MASAAARSDPWRKAAVAATILALLTGVAMSQALGADAAHPVETKWSFDIAPGGLRSLDEALDLAPTDDELGVDPMFDHDFDWLAGDDVAPPSEF